MRYYDPKVCARLMALAQGANKQDKLSLYIACSSLSALKALQSISVFKPTVDKLIINGLAVCFAPGFLREKKKSKKKREKRTIAPKVGASSRSIRQSAKR